jgi:hypothetical protein
VNRAPPLAVWAEVVAAARPAAELGGQVWEVRVGMKTDRIQTDITDIVFVFVFMSGFGFEYE